MTDSIVFSAWQGGDALRCLSRHGETHDSATFVMEADYPARFVYKPGQFVTVGVEIDGEKHVRAYSISSTPSRPETLAITIKRVEGGLVSNYLLDHFKPGDRIDISAPAGEFFLNTDAPPRKIVLLSSGSGITPMMSISRWLLDGGHDTLIHFIHSARSEQDIIFREELLELANRHRNFRLELFLSQSDRDIACYSGRLSADRLNALLPETGSCQVFLCGQQSYMDMIDTWRTDRNIGNDRFHKESFSPAAAESPIDSAEVFSLSIPKFGKTADIRAGESLLDAMEKEGLPIIGACRSGVCGSCKCKVTGGETVSSSTATLTPQEVADGYVLACSTHARGAVVVDLQDDMAVRR